MSVVSCPHCGQMRIVTTKVPKDVVVMLPCPECHELVVLFRGKVIGLNRTILESGSKEERKNHIAEIIEEFLPPELFSGATEWDFGEDGKPFPFPGGKRARSAFMNDSDDDGDDDDAEPISDEEMERFLKFELQRIDERRYFKRHFER